MMLAVLSLKMLKSDEEPRNCASPPVRYAIRGAINRGSECFSGAINRGSECFSGAPVNKNLPLFLCLLIKN
jgi:hypothetical protein